MYLFKKGCIIINNKEIMIARRQLFLFIIFMKNLEIVIHIKIFALDEQYQYFSEK